MRDAGPHAADAVTAAALGTATGGALTEEAGAPSVVELREWTRRLGLDSADGDDTERIERLRALEELRCAVAGAQSEVTADFVTSQREAAEARGVPAAWRSRGLAAQVALARRVSHARGHRAVALAMALRTELPHTRAALRTGQISEWKATLVARETACLSLPDRRTVDERVVGDGTTAASMGDRQLVSACTALGAKLDAASLAARRRQAEADRHTTLRPAPDTMTWLGALLTVKDGVAVHAALMAEADRLTAAGDERSRGAIMADTLVDRVLRPHLGVPGSRPALMVNVVVSDRVLLGDAVADDGEAHVDGHGEVPGDLLREWLAEHAEAGTQDFVRRLYAAPATGELVAMDSRARHFDGRLAEFLRMRDRRCRTPWCDAPIRHLDHAQPVAEHGATSAANGQGLCQACNHAKQADGWRARVTSQDGRHAVETTTPTGHRYLSVAPATGPPA